MHKIITFLKKRILLKFQDMGICTALRRQESERNEYSIVLATQHPFSPSPADSILFPFILLSDSHEAEHHSS